MSARAAILRCALALFAALALAAPAHAATSCTGSMTNLNFAATTGAAVDATATLTVTCSTGALSLLARARVNMCVSIFSGTDGGGTLAPRRMTNTPGDAMQMQLYTDGARSQIWGARGNATVPNFLPLQFDYEVIAIGGSQTLTATLYGRIPAQTALNAGTYRNRFTAAADTRIEFQYAEALLGTPPMPASCVSGGSTGTPSSFPFTVNGSVPNTCALSPKPVPDLAFGSVPGYVTANVDRTTAIGLTCTGRTAWQLGIGNGLNASGNIRRMRSAGGQFVPYELYRDSGRSQRWGTTLGTDTVSGTGTGAAQSQTVYGRVAPQTATPGSYTDTVVVTVTY
ncbi:Csu type fimbrial protein [Lysobacter enzymogenes]|uniref:Csu type fimbrial protein n=1 Tax=Lysobacter enzymogenes TaxID=69 RepID=UPI00099B413D|nr:spore coat U domain-containing protein [Lysobacter enzymogenes]UZW60505.1 spore coat U domain-containing protein [Lysobacter enzymogenes]